LLAIGRSLDCGEARTESLFGKLAFLVPKLDLAVPCVVFFERSIGGSVFDLWTLAFAAAKSAPATFVIRCSDGAVGRGTSDLGNRLWNASGFLALGGAFVNFT
jgi:hypothetical protein